MGRSRSGANNQQLLQTLQYLDSSQNRTDILDERKRRDLELENAKERELGIKETADSEAELKRSFEAGTGVALDADTRQYAKPYEENAKKKATLKANSRRQPTEYRDQSFFEKFTHQPKVPLPKAGYTAPELGPEVGTQVQEQIRTATRNRLEAGGFIGEQNRNSPNFDEGFHNLMTGPNAPVIAPSKALDEAEKFQKTRALVAKTRKDTTEADTSEKTAQDYIRQQALETKIKEQTLRKGIIDADIAAWQSAIAPGIEADRQKKAILDNKKTEAEIAKMPKEAEHLQSQIDSLNTNTVKTQQEIDKHKRISKLGADYQAANDEVTRNKIGRQIMVEQGNMAAIMDQDYKANNDAVKYAMESASSVAKGRTIQAADPTNIAAIKSHFDAANLAAARSATLGGGDLVTMYNVKSDPGFGVGTPAASVESVQVGRNYAIAKQKGQVSDYIYAPPPEGVTPQEMREKVLPGQAAMLGWSLIDNFPGLRGNIAAFDAKVDTIPGIDPQMKALAKSYMADQMGKRAQDEQNRARLESVPAEVSRDPIDQVVEGGKKVAGQAVRSLQKGQMSNEMDLSSDIVKDVKGRKLPPTTLKAKEAPVKEAPEIKPAVSNYTGKQAPEAKQKEADSGVLKDVRVDVSEAFRLGKRYKNPKDATFPQWIAEQAMRENRDPNTYTAKDFTGFWNLWNRTR